MKVLVITIGDHHAGSTKYRILQYVPLLQGRGVEFDYLHRREIDAFTVRKAAETDIVFNQKALFSFGLSKRIINSSRRVIFDFDDAIYTRPGKGYGWLTQKRITRRLHFWLLKSDLVMTANRYLTQYALNHTSRVQTIPMSLNLDEWRPKEHPVFKTVTIGWAGSPGNLINIERIEPVLAQVMRRRRNVKLAIFSGSRPRLSVQFSYHPFRPEDEVRFVQQLDIGLLPLVDEEHSRGKSPIKAIQYLACGVPVVGNVVGATKDILNPRNSIAVNTEREWISALNGLIDNLELARGLGKNGRELVEQRHDMGKNCELLWECLMGTANTARGRPQSRLGERQRG
jgi:glycosyltransferase involved in cell wall biosynthesis